MLPDTILHIANHEETHWLLQPELKAIKDGLIYVEDKDCHYKGDKAKYRGYLNAQGQRQGVGMVISRLCVIGEWHENELHGIARKDFNDFEDVWG